jgi:hypothetical protein
MNETWRRSRRSRREREARVCGPRIAQGASRGAKTQLRNLRQTVRSSYSMRHAHVKTGMLKKRALYWQMLVCVYPHLNSVKQITVSFEFISKGL